METMHKRHHQTINRFIKNHATEVFCLGRIMDTHYIPNVDNVLYNIIWSTKEMMDGLIDKDCSIDIIGFKLKLGKGYFNIPIGAEYSARCTFIAATSTTITSQVVVTSSDDDLVCLAYVTGSIYRQSNVYPIPSVITSAIESAHQEEIPDIIISASNQEYLYYRMVTVVRPSEIGQNGHDIETTNYINYCFDGIQKAISTNSDYETTLGQRWIAKIRYLQSEIKHPVAWCQRITIHLRLYITNQILSCNIVDDQNNVMCVVLIKMELGSSTTVNVMNPPKTKFNTWQPNPLEIQIFSTRFGYYRDRYGNSDLGKMFRIMGELRVASWLQGYMGWDQFYLKNNYGAVIASHTVKIKSNAYNLQNKADINLNLKLFALRKSSLAIRHQLKLKTNPTDILIEMITVIVFTHNSKPIPLPAQFMDKYAKLVSGHKMPDKVIPYTEKSNNTFSHVMLPRECEFDGNQHVNNASFVTYCLDAACLAIQNRSSAYTYDYSDDINPQIIDQIDIIYVNQVRRKDELIIETWQDASSNLNFDIKNAKDGTTTCRACFRLANVTPNQSKL